MPPKKDLKSAQKNPKQSFPLKDLPPPSIKQPVREPRVPKPSEPYLLEKRPEYKGFPLPAEWPGDEQAKFFDFGTESQIKFTDNAKIQTPASFAMGSSQITFWRRPKEFILDEMEEKSEAVDNGAMQRRGSNPFDGNKGQGKSKFRSMATVSYEKTNKIEKDKLFRIEDDIRVHSPKKREKDLPLQLKVFFYLKS